MADKKISQLTDGTSLQSGDEVVIARSGANYKVDPTQFGSSIDVTGTITADGLVVQGSAITAVIEASSSNAGLRLSGLSTNTSARNWDIRSNNAAFGDLVFLQGASQGATPSVKRMAIDVNGDISFYEDTGTTPKFFWDASAESLGIGTTSPYSDLTVIPSTTPTSVGTATQVSIGEASANSAYALKVGYFLESGAYKSSIQSIAGGSGGTLVLNGDGGNVGIGTTSPSELLHLNGATNAQIRMQPDATGSSGFISTTSGSVKGMVQYNHSSDYMRIYTNGDEAMRIDSNGALLIHPNNATRGLKITTTQTTAVGDTTTYDTIGAGYGRHIFKTDGTERMRIDSSGDVGIGTTNPAFAVGSGLEIERAGNATLRLQDTTNTANAEIRTGPSGIEFYTGAFGTSGLPFSFSQAGTTRMVIDSSGNVGIGVTSNITGDITLPNNGIIAFHDAAGNGRNVLEFASGELKHGAAGAGVTLQTFYISGNEKARLDASGNLLVGTTSAPSTLATTGSVEGLGYAANDYLVVSRSSGTPLILNRITDDGDILSFRKDGTVVGSIGTDSTDGYFQVKSNSIELQLRNNQDTGVNIRDNGGVNVYMAPDTDADYLLGNSSLRWKDLYLSGGVYLGGTAAANLLDDYEEGTFTPVLTGSTSGTLNGTGVYTKVGNKVTIFITFTVTTGTKPTGDYSITGLPFTSKTTSPDATAFIVEAVRVTFDSAKRFVAAVAQNSSDIFIGEATSNAVASAITDANFVNGSNMFFRVNGTYLVA